MDSIFQSPSAPQKLKELESNKIDFACRYNDVSSGISDLGCGIRLQLEDSNYVLPCEIGPICRKPGNFFNIFHLNCQGLNSSYSFIEDLANISVFQVIALTETWLNVHNSELLGLEGYIFTQKIGNYVNMGALPYILDRILK